VEWGNWQWHQRRAPIPEWACHHWGQRFWHHCHWLYYEKRWSLTRSVIGFSKIEELPISQPWILLIPGLMHLLWTLLYHMITSLLKKKKIWWKDGVNNGESEDGYLEEVGNETRSWGLVIFDCRSCWFCCSIFTHRERERRMVCASLLFVFFESLHCLDFFLWGFFFKNWNYFLYF